MRFPFPKTCDNPHRLVSIIKHLYRAPRDEGIKEKIHSLASKMIFFFPRASKQGNIEILVYLLNNSDLFRKKGTLKLNYKGISCLFYYQKISYTVEALVSDHLGTRGNSHVKITGLLVVSLRGVNCRFCSHFGCLGWKVTIFAHWKVTKFTKNVLTLTTWKSPLGVS